MSELTPNLDDGELWLPSDIFRDLDQVEDFARTRQIASLSFLDGASTLFSCSTTVLKSPSSIPAPRRHANEFKPLGPVGSYVPMDSEFVSDRFVYDEFRHPGGKVGMFPAGGISRYFFRPGVVKFSFLEPAQANMERFELERVQMLLRTVLPVQARFVPLPVAGAGRESGGTGVFLPRVNEVKKKPHVRGEHKKQNAAVWKRQGAFQTQTEMGLPADVRGEHK